MLTIAAPFAVSPPYWLLEFGLRGGLVVVGLLLLLGAYLLRAHSGWKWGLGIAGGVLAFLGAGALLAPGGGGKDRWQVLLAVAGGVLLIKVTLLLIAGLWDTRVALGTLVVGLLGVGGWLLGTAERDF